ncbi:pentapeptide repeat-containing protein [Streptomyces sp. NPDC004031]
MDSRRFGDIIVTPPNLDSPGSRLSTVSFLDTSRGAIEDFQYVGERLRDLDLTSTRLLCGRLAGVEADRGQLEDTQLHSVELTGCTVTALRCTGSRFSRVVFRDCTFTGATFEDCTFDNVLFDGCRLDYATFAGVRAIGPLVFTACSLVEAELTGSDLAEETALAHCTLRRTAFGAGDYRGTDLRGSDLTTLVGVGNLTGAVVSSGQEHQLAQAFLAAMDLTVSDEER